MFKVGQGIVFEVGQGLLTAALFRFGQETFSEQSGVEVL